jgi:flagellar M-ring protein FliF
MPALRSPLRDLRSLKDIPLVRQLGLLAGLALAIAAGVTLFTWSQQPGYVPLYANLAEKDSAELADALRAAAIPFKLDAGTGAVTVPADKVHEARMRAASQGLPRGSSMGFEMIQQEQGFGTSQFIESARWQLALETELARTISSLQPVKGARVHLALPKPSAFARTTERASASVVVELYSGRQLDPNQVASIAHIVASSVPDLSASAVTVIDQFGRLLSQSGEGEFAQSAEQYQYARRAEADYVRRIEQILTPMLGAEHVKAQVSADFDFDAVEEARESYKPDGAVVRSEQTSEEISRNGSGQPQGIPGATSNQAPQTSGPAPTPIPAANAQATANGQAPAASTTAASSDQPSQQSRNSTRNYELDRTVSHTRRTVGQVRRLSVAVLVDQISRRDDKGQLSTTPLAPEDLAKVEALVRQAVGFDPARGDAVTVQNAPFLAADVARPDPLPIWKRPELRDWARQILGGLIVLVLVLAVLRPLLRNFMSGSRTGMVSELPEGAGPQAIAAAGGGPAQTGDEPAALRAAPRNPYEEKLAQARSAVAQDPKRVAQVVKTWINEDG